MFLCIGFAIVHSWSWLAWSCLATTQPEMLAVGVFLHVQAPLLHQMFNKPLSAPQQNRLQTTLTQTWLILIIIILL